MLNNTKNNNTTIKSKRTIAKLIVVGASVASLSLPAFGEVIIGSTADFRVFEQGSPFGDSYFANFETDPYLNVTNDGSTDIRPIFQFDLSQLTATQINAAEIQLVGSRNVTSNSFETQPDFNVKIYGRSDNLSEELVPTSVSDTNATGEFFNTGYTRLDSDISPFAEPTDETYFETGIVADSTRSLDITPFLQSAFNEYQNGSGDSWVLFKLEADETSSNWQYRFESADGRTGLEPKVVVNASVPEPSLIASVFGLCALLAVMRRSKRD